MTHKLETAPAREETVRSLIIGSTPGAVSLVVEPFGTVAFELSGRPIGLHENGFYYARGLDGRYLEKKWIAGRRHIRALSEVESQRTDRRVAQILRFCRDQCDRLADAGLLEFYDSGVRREAARGRFPMLDDIAGFLENSLNYDRVRFAQVYRPVGILPPDHYLSILLQVTEGCAWNRCTFCSSYAGVPFRVRSREEIAAHIQQVASFFGAGLSRRVSIFLGAANAFEAPPDLLRWTCESALRRFPSQAVPQRDGVGGIYSFGDPSRLAAWRVKDLEELRRLGLRRVYLGVESGAPALRRWMKKPGGVETARRAVQKLKEAGVAAGVILLLGPGGAQNDSEHADESARLLEKLPLDAQDMVYFSPVRCDGASAYGRGMDRRGWKRLTAEDEVDQLARITRALKPWNRGGPRTAVYDVREFLY